jgi:hypothetical protein
VEVLLVVGILVVALLFAEALSMSVGADSREQIGDDHARSTTSRGSV